MLDGLTGTPLLTPTIPPSTFTSFSGQQTSGYSRVGPPMVDPDGVVYLLYEKRFLMYPPQVVDTGIWLMTVNTDQTWTTTQLNSATENTNLFPGRIIPDGDGGLLATWIDSPIVPAGPPPPQSVFRAAGISSGGAITLFDLPLTPPLQLLLQPSSQLRINPELAKVKLENDATLLNPTCSTWFNSGLGSTTAADYRGLVILPNRFAHAEVSYGGTVVGGESTSAFTGAKNSDGTLVEGIVADTAVHFNRNGAFFRGFYSLAAQNPPRQHKVGPYGGATERARVTVALHELAHILQDRNGDTVLPVSVSHVPGFQTDGGDRTGAKSEKNTQLIVNTCKVMIERP